MKASKSAKKTWKRAFSGFLALFLLILPFFTVAQAGTVVAPYVLIIFDTSGSMAWRLDSDDKLWGDGSMDPWTWDAGVPDLYCCPGSFDPRYDDVADAPRVYHAKNAVTMMVHASSNVIFGLMKFPQHYATLQEDSGQVSHYRYNQDPDKRDNLRYWGGECPEVDLGVYDGGAPVGEDAAYYENDWWVVDFSEKNKEEMLMWFDHHEYSTDESSARQADVSGFPGPYNDYTEQEIRTQGSTPVTWSLVNARKKIARSIAEQVDPGNPDGLNPDCSDPQNEGHPDCLIWMRRWCRPYHVVLLTDGCANCDGDPVEAAQMLRDIRLDQDGGPAPDDHRSYRIYLHPIAFAMNSTTCLNRLHDCAAAAGSGLWDPDDDEWKAYVADDQDSLATILAQIAEGTVLREICNAEDDDCDGLTDEDFPGKGQVCGDYPELWGIGLCSAGSLECIDGAEQCEGEQGPETEKCDGVDNNCNGLIDEGCDECISEQEVCDGVDNDCDDLVDNDDDDLEIPSGSCKPENATCGRGHWECIDGELSCIGDSEATDEVCNGFDDDCDDLIDEDFPEKDDECGDYEELWGIGECAPGRIDCIDGELECVDEVGPAIEICDGLDNDCDGSTDEEEDSVPCPSGSVCDEGECVFPCRDSEFPCPPGRKCENGYCREDRCYEVECDGEPGCPAGECECVDGECINMCEDVECEDEERCVRGECVPDDCYNFPCPEDEICRMGECIADPCEGVKCRDNEFCRDGDCIRSCEGVECYEGQSCRDGECYVDACKSVHCRDKKVCDNGICVDDPCEDVDCDYPLVCRDGECMDEPCSYIECPDGQICIWDTCGNPKTRIDDAEPVDGMEKKTPAQRVLSAGGASGGLCSAAPGRAQGTSTGQWLIMILALSALLCFSRRGGGYES